MKQIFQQLLLTISFCLSLFIQESYAQGISQESKDFSTALGVLVASDFQEMNLVEKIQIIDFRRGFTMAFAKTPLMSIEEAMRIIEPAIQANAQKKTIPTLESNFSLAFGTLLATQFGTNFSADILDVHTFLPAFEATLLGNTDISATQAQETFQNIIIAEMQKQQENILANKATLEAAGKTFLAENAKKKGIKATSSGLQYQIITKAKKKAKIATPTSYVTVHYHGTLIDGTVFDSSIERQEPISFNLDQVIEGWQEGLQLMAEGAKFKLYIPHELAYGSEQAGEIPPFSTLIFEVELIKVE